MTRPRRSTPGIAFAADRAGRFQTGTKIPGARTVSVESAEAVPEPRKPFDIVAVGRRVEATTRRRRALTVAGGTVLVAFALVPRGLVGAALAIVGGALVVRGLTGQSLGGVAKRVARTLGSLRARDRRDRVDQA